MTREEAAKKFGRPVVEFNQRADGRLEWVCKHSVGHTVWDPSGRPLIHGCDGCCNFMTMKKLAAVTPARGTPEFVLGVMELQKEITQLKSDKRVLSVQLGKFVLENYELSKELSEYKVHCQARGDTWVPKAQE